MLAPISLNTENTSLGNNNSRNLCAVQSFKQALTEDKVEISSGNQQKKEISSANQQKSGLSNTTKLLLGLGAIGVIVGGFLLHKRLTSKGQQTVQQGAQQATNKLQELLNSGRLTDKDVEIFNQIKGLEGDEFATKAYELVSQDMGLTTVPELILSHNAPSPITLGHSGKDITMFIDNYKMENSKAEILNTIRHELEHYRQSIIIFFQKGEDAYKDAFTSQKVRRFALDASLELENNPELTTNEALNTALQYEARRLGIAPQGRNINVISEEEAISSGLADFQNDLITEAFERETPITLLRTICPEKFEAMRIPQEELAKADSYLEGVREYGAIEWIPEQFWTDGHVDVHKLANTSAGKFFSEIRQRYLYNPIEVGARREGESIRDKFIAFLGTQ